MSDSAADPGVMHAVQEADVETMKADRKDNHNVQKQEEGLAETVTMIPDTHSRLERAMSDMQELLASEDCRYLGDSEEVVAGRAVLEEAQAAFRRPRGTGPVPLIPPVLRGR